MMRLIGRLNRLLWGVNLALVAVVLFVAAAFLAPGRSDRDDIAAPRSANAARTPDAAGQTTRDTIDPKLILDRDIFGTGPEAGVGGPGKTSGTAVEQPKPLIAKELPLRLLGTVVDEQGSSYAILENAATKAQDIYRVGDTIGEVRIDSIEQNKIVVVKMGMRETLNMALTGGGTPTTMVANDATPAEPVKMGSNEVIKLVSDSEREINVSASGDSVSQAARFLSKLRLTPHATDGQADGLRISGVGDSTVARLVGLQDGDVIESVNGHRVSNQAKASQVLRKARMLGAAEIELVRGQERKTLAFRAGSW